MPCEFSKQHYFDTLLKAKDLGYEIKRVCDYSDDKKVILLRHDIDFSLDYAHKLATYEERFGIKSSYYVYLHTQTYNALSPEGMDIIRKIKKLGHEIGLHYDSRYDLKYEDAVLADINKEKDIKSYTQHNPSMTKSFHFLDPNDVKIKYISDSGRNWREGCFCKWIGKEDKLHVLVHPIWWVGNGNSRAEIVHNMILDTKKNIDKAHGDIKQMYVEYERELANETSIL